MRTEPMSVTYSISVEQLGDFASHDLWVRSRKALIAKAVVCLVSLGIGGGVTGQFLAFHWNVMTKAILYTVIGATAGGVLAALIMFGHYFAIVTRAALVGVRNGAVGTHVMVIAPDGVVVKNPASETKWKWIAFQRLEKTDEFLAFYLQGTLALIVPLRSFTSAESGEEFLRAAKQWFADSLGAS